VFIFGYIYSDIVLMMIIIYGANYVLHN